MKRSLTTVRRIRREGEHLYNCFADVEVRKQGWKMMQMAKRIAARLGFPNMFEV